MTPNWALAWELWRPAESGECGTSANFAPLPKSVDYEKDYNEPLFIMTFVIIRSILYALNF
jgi:hypothetical protein